MLKKEHRELEEAQAVVKSARIGRDQVIQALVRRGETAYRISKRLDISQSAVAKILNRIDGRKTKEDAREFIQDICDAARKDVTYKLDDYNNVIVTSKDGRHRFAIATTWEQGKVVGYTWTSYEWDGAERGQGIWEEMEQDGDPLQMNAEAAIATWLNSLPNNDEEEEGGER
jgi:murein DD-endopeptidase MepM/ murein hydrolase activator NlpD